MVHQRSLLHGIQRGDPLDVENDDGKSWSVMVDIFHFCCDVLRGEVAVNKSSRGAGKKNEESRRAQEPTLASGVYALV
jgi:hypothetical protein